MNPPGESKHQGWTVCKIIGMTYAILCIIASTYESINFLSKPKHLVNFRKNITDLHLEVDSSLRVADFSRHHNYTRLDRQYDWLWKDNLLPPNGGYLARYNDAGNPDQVGVSMFHQLHCLSMIREGMQHLHQMIVTLKTSDFGDIQAHQQGDVGDMGAVRASHYDEEHVLHCFDYLRQTMLCLADSTIERPKQLPDGRRYIDGMGRRKCKNWELVYAASTTSDTEPMWDNE